MAAYCGVCEGKCSKPSKHFWRGKPMSAYETGGAYRKPVRISSKGAYREARERGRQRDR